MTSSNRTQLTTSRINRLFRPLRAKCTALAEYTSPATHRRHAASITYSQHSRTRPPTSADHDAPPLAILQPPESLGSRIHLDRASIDNLQLSRKIYEVRDAFRNIVQVVIVPDAASGSRVLPCIRSLAAMCAAVVGENIQAEIAAQDGEFVGELEEPSEDIAANVQEELYEAVPPHHRSHTVLSHALSLTLDTCPHHPTLLAALLEICLSYALIPESHLILNNLFREAICSSTSYGSKCPLLHPAHSNWLTTLRESCCNGPRTNASTSYYRIDNWTFATLLVDALADSPATARMDAWTSRAVARLARELRVHEFSAFIQLCSGLVRDIAESEHDPARRRLKRKANNEAATDNRLHPRLAKWTKSALDHLVAGARAAPAALDEDYQWVIDVLVHVSASSLQINGPSDTCKPHLVDVLTSLGTYCLANPTFSSLAISDRERLVAFLRTVTPTSETFDTLVGVLFAAPDAPSSAGTPPEPDRSPSELSECTPTPTPTPPPPPSPPRHLSQTEVLQFLRPHARALRAHALFALEARLWSTALRNTEDMLLARSAAAPFLAVPRTGREERARTMVPVSSAELHALREELVWRVDAAEARCFRPAPTGGGAREWVWEEMVGSWVQTSPAGERAPKRRRTLGAEPGLRPLLARELDAPRRTRSNAREHESAVPLAGGRPRAFDKPEGRAPVRMQPGRQNNGPSQASRESTPTLRAASQHGDEEETLAASDPDVEDFESFPGLSQKRWRASPSPPPEFEHHGEFVETGWSRKGKAALGPTSQHQTRRTPVGLATPRLFKQASRSACPSPGPEGLGGSGGPPRFASKATLNSEGRTGLPTARGARRPSSTLLSDALRNVICLHPERRTSLKKPAPAPPRELAKRAVHRVCAAPQPGYAHHYGCDEPEERDEDEEPILVRENAADQLSSDDALNLFAYESSPAAPSRRRSTVRNI